MDLPATLFPGAGQGVMLALAVLGLYLTLRHAPWGRLRQPAQLNLLLGFAVGLMLIWSMKAGVKPGLSLHMLGAMAATLALGPWFAVLALGLALSGIMVNGVVEWTDWPVNFVLMVMVPIAFAHVFQRAVERWLPAHFFIFVFVIGFAGAALTVVVQGLVASAAMVSAGAYSAGFLLNEYLPFFLLLGFSEAWISGAVITLMVVYRPEWVAAFDDRRYLLDK
ncbi:energy-coupling factor ABC transporter permease [Thauera sp.]|jgi:uncharacterized membrane protein|uniref:energy-coupling factor ABC transporter permease n=1 Tax=Thauera sp. TaxID=1905334 RepID=UPI002A36D9D6|nr:energy-coupling factor ABC transporter permease [Thauera sp.]MDX9886305.1 energy-coupling factor ABC transporter permease [Thauera sp.]